jgi:hypothetical protein
MMKIETTITDVRTAKAWFDAQADDFDALRERLATVQLAYQTRTGPFAALPTQPPPTVKAAIAAAPDEPGRDLLQETRKRAV